MTDYINKGELRTDAGSWFVEGIGEDFIPNIADFSLAKQAFTISDKESFDAVRGLLNNEGVLAGSSTGTLLSAAIKYAKQQTTPKRIVTIACDSGNKYLSKMYNEFWMKDNDIDSKILYGDLRDIISRRFDENAIVSLEENDTFKTAYSKMKLYDISQLPVLDGSKVIGIVDEYDLLFAGYERKSNKDTPIKDIMTKNPITIKYDSSIDELAKVLQLGLMAIVESPEGDFKGLITKIDFINHLQKTA